MSFWNFRRRRRLLASFPLGTWSVSQNRTARSARPPKTREVEGRSGDIGPRTTRPVTALHHESQCAEGKRGTPSRFSPLPHRRHVAGTPAPARALGAGQKPRCVRMLAAVAKGPIKRGGERSAHERRTRKAGDPASWWPPASPFPRGLRVGRKCHPERYWQYVPNRDGNKPTFWTNYLVAWQCAVLPILVRKRLVRGQPEGLAVVGRRRLPCRRAEAEEPGTLLDRTPRSVAMRPLAVHLHPKPVDAHREAPTSAVGGGSHRRTCVGWRSETAGRLRARVRVSATASGSCRGCSVARPVRGCPGSCLPVHVPAEAGVDGLAAAGAAGAAEIDQRGESGSGLAVRSPVGAGAVGAADRLGRQRAAVEARAWQAGHGVRW
jgi:hypothetical protein